jgi:hypothetical protein
MNVVDDYLCIACCFFMFSCFQVHSCATNTLRAHIMILTCMSTILCTEAVVEHGSSVIPSAIDFLSAPEPVLDCCSFLPGPAMRHLTDVNTQVVASATNVSGIVCHLNSRRVAVSVFSNDLGERISVSTW